MIVERSERHIIKKNNEFFNLLKIDCHKAKNLYNQANYLIRQEFCKNENHKYLGYKEVEKLCKDGLEFNAYRNMPTAQSAQQTLKQLDKNWKSFFKLIKDWKINKSKYQGKPKLPKYLPKDGETILYLTNQNCKLKEDGKIYFPKYFNGFTVNTDIHNQPNFISFQQIQIKPHKDYLEIFVIYRTNIHEFKADNGRYLFIDLGVDNFATVVNNIGKQNILIDGKGLKSKNQWYNKIIAETKSSLKIVNNSYFSNRLESILTKRNNVILDDMHKKSKFIVNYANELNISKIVIGHNKSQKDSSKLGKINNQNFVQIPHFKFINLLKYKLENVGIELIEVEESYTSKCSFIDWDNLPERLMEEKQYFSGKRVHRGLYKTKDKFLINADVNGALNIGRKAEKKLKSNLKELSDRVEWLVSSPIRLKVA